MSTSRPTATQGRAPRRPFRASAAGFSLMEILVALGIFAIGLVAVASIFPTAIAIQSETVRDLAGQRVAMNARSQIQALARSANPNETYPPRYYDTLTYLHDPDPALRRGTLHDYTVPANMMINSAQGRMGFLGGVMPMIDQPLPNASIPAFAEQSASIPRLNAAKSFDKLFSLDVRSFPKTISQVDRRDYYWYPLIQARSLVPTEKPTWMVYLMVMQRRGTEAIPQVRAVEVVNTIGTDTIEIRSTDNGSNIWLDNDLDDDDLPDVIQPGDWVLGDDGSMHRIALTEGKNRLKVGSSVPPNGLRWLYYAIAIDRIDGTIKRETRSPIVRIEQFELVVDEPGP